MNARQRKFCDEYLIDCNATKAAIRAGYKPKTAHSASEWINEKNMKKPTSKYNREMREYIDTELERIHNEKTADAAEVIEYLTAVMRGEYTEEVLQLDASGGQKIANMEVSAKDRIKAAELIGKRLGIWNDKTDLTLNVPVIFIGEKELAD